ncbi:hypothetical protein TWF730_009134 [Orbilia blumenaviensis]|uniref:Peptidase A1 domain-containing protein n=1 Tax=Orbilia blumenaviensis TaxID=1796055 RepID=A0AAV9UY40_9PEZI
MTTVGMRKGGVIEPAVVELVIESERGDGGVNMDDMMLKVGKLGLDPTIPGMHIVNNPTLHATIVSVLTNSLYTYEQSIDAYITPCSSTSPIANRTLQFTFKASDTGDSEVKIKVTADQLIYKLGDGRCYLAVHKGAYNFEELGTDEFDISLGLSFFRNAYLLYDQANNQLSIAPSVPDSITQNLVDVNSVIRANQLTGTGPTPIERPQVFNTGSNMKMRVIGIAVGTTLAGLLLSGLVFIFFKRWKQGRSQESKGDSHWQVKSELEGGDQMRGWIHMELPGTPYIEVDEGRTTYELPGIVTIDGPTKSSLGQSSV